MTGVLDDLRVLEVGDPCGEYAGRLLAGFGADVVKLEPLGGAASRRVGPFYRDEPHPDRSLHFWHYNVGKRAAAVDLTHPDGRALLERLAQSFDVVIAAGAPVELELMGFVDGDMLRCVNPRLILVTITPFGLDGPWRDWPATDLTLMALGGSMAACGYGPDDPPLACAGWQAYQTACVYAVHGLMGAVLARDLSRRGQDVEVSIHEAAVSITEWHVPQYIFTRLVSPRAVLGLQFLSRDGIMVSTLVAEFLASDMIERLCRLLAADRLDATLRDPALRADRTRLHANVASALERYCALHTADEIYRAGQSVGFPWAPCRTPDENLRRPAPVRPRLLGAGVSPGARAGVPVRRRTVHRACVPMALPSPSTAARRAHGGSAGGGWRG